MNTHVFSSLSALSLALLLISLTACSSAEDMVGEWTLESQGRYTRLVLNEGGDVDIYTRSGPAGTGQWTFNGSSNVLRIEFDGASWSGIHSSGSLAFQSKGRDPTIYRKSEF